MTFFFLFFLTLVFDLFIYSFNSLRRGSVDGVCSLLYRFLYYYRVRVCCFVFLASAVWEL